MSWLADLEYDYKYNCAAGHTSLFRMPAATPPEVLEAGIDCIECGEPAHYAGFVPIKLGMTGRVLFEQNGRYGYEIRRPDGSVKRISKTKWDYLDSFGRGDVDPTKEKVAAAKVTPAYTPAYREHLRKTGKAHLLEESFIHAKRQAEGATVQKGVGDE